MNVFSYLLSVLKTLALQKNIPIANLYRHTIKFEKITCHGFY